MDGCVSIRTNTGTDTDIARRVGEGVVYVGQGAESTHGEWVADEEYIYGDKERGNEGDLYAYALRVHMPRTREKRVGR
jgi:hypothetical protein